MPSEWYESFFTALAFDFWRAAVPASVTAAEVEAFVRELAVIPPAKLLDLPSGAGRHSLLLASHGFRVTGVDLSPHAIAAARRAASESGLDVTFVEGDMRQPPPGGLFEAALCLGNSFGYLSTDDMRDFVGHLRNAVRPGGRWAIDTGAVAEALLPHLEPERTLEAGGVTYHVRSWYDARAKRLRQSCTLERGSERQTAEISHAVYTVAELRTLLEDAGWRVLRTYGSLDGRPFVPGDRRLLLIAQRPSNSDKTT
jgi:SAM-dependent methyltransferase